jgi:hypothetical protein
MKGTVMLAEVLCFLYAVVEVIRCSSTGHAGEETSSQFTEIMLEVVGLHKWSFICINSKYHGGLDFVSPAQPKALGE